jgi:hypothetical protein
MRCLRSDVLALLGAIPRFTFKRGFDLPAKHQTPFKKDQVVVAVDLEAHASADVGVHAAPLRSPASTQDRPSSTH